MFAKVAHLTIAAIVSAAPVTAQSTGHAHVPGMAHNTRPETTTVLATEPGQGAFGAISEIVTILAGDPDTDWSKVNITALRDHLVDMDMLVTTSVVVSRPVPGGLEMQLDLALPGNGAASRMVPAHAPIVTAETNWASDVVKNGETLIWTVTSPKAQTQIRALGFFGLMATGDHHRAHHLGMAKGAMVH